MSFVPPPPPITPGLDGTMTTHPETPPHSPPVIPTPHPTILTPTTSKKVINNMGVPTSCGTSRLLGTPTPKSSRWMSPHPPFTHTFTMSLTGTSLFSRTLHLKLHTTPVHYHDRSVAEQYPPNHSSSPCEFWFQSTPPSIDPHPRPPPPLSHEHALFTLVWSRYPSTALVYRCLKQTYPKTKYPIQIWTPFCRYFIVEEL
eukprot:763209-Hanusia_phi.AAC.2